MEARKARQSSKTAKFGEDESSRLPRNEARKKMEQYKSRFWVVQYTGTVSLSLSITERNHLISAHQPPRRTDRNLRALIRPMHLHAASLLFLSTIYTKMQPLLQDFSNNLRRFLVSPEQLLALLPLALDRVVFVEQFLEQLLLVQLADKAVLHDVFAVVDEQVHDGLGDLVGRGLAHDGKV
jgi:hypothetical protein